ncbi:MAG: ABC transporter ATP-binding protein [Phycisphaerales bacterium]
MSLAIAVRDVSKHYPAPGGGTIAAVDGVNLDIAPGELFFLLGPSGCGKTTLLRMIAGFTEPTAGAIAFGGRDVTRTPPEKRNTGMVFQSYALWPHMTVEANVAFGLSVRRVSKAERAARVAEALAAVRMEGYAARAPNQLSGGQQQRVALARALVVRPDVLLLDEPLSNLDAKLRSELRVEIRRICKDSGITTVYVTHDQKEALSMADRVAILDRGSVVQVGPPRTLYRRPATRFAAEFLGDTNFLAATVAERAPGRTLLDTPAGRLRSTAAPPPLAGGEQAVCSIRPESLRIVSEAAARDAANVIRGRVVSCVYLGETAQLEVEAPGGARLRVAQLNPQAPPTLAADPASDLVLAIDPDDVVILPAS